MIDMFFKKGGNWCSIESKAMPIGRSMQVAYWDRKTKQVGTILVDEIGTMHNEWECYDEVQGYDND